MAQFISRRDGYAADTEDIYLTSGGAHGIQVRTGSALFAQFFLKYCSFSVRPGDSSAFIRTVSQSRRQAVIQSSSSVVRTCQTHG